MTAIETTSPYGRDLSEASVLVVDGYGVSLTVGRGHLIVRDGIGRQRRERRLPKAQRTVRRIVILGHTGHISLEAVRWCHDTGIGLMQVEPDGTVLLTSGKPGRDDARLRRSQAAAATNAHGLLIARNLLTAKVNGQAAVLERHAISASVAASVRAIGQRIAIAGDLSECRDLEAQAANLYFGAWSAQVTCIFAVSERPKVPDHWTVFAARGSVLHGGGRSPRSAADPINALLNYGYALVEAEAQLALRALGLDPGLGIIHTDKVNRDSLALDIMEPVRPTVDDLVLTLLGVRRFKATDFHETPQGGCRLLPQLTHELTEHLPHLRREVAIHAEAVASVLTQASPGRVELRTPLTRSISREAQVAPAPAKVRSSAPKRATATCRTCGEALSHPTRQLCPQCWNVTRRELATQRSAKANESLAAMRARGFDPTNSEDASTKRAATLSARKREELAWQPTDEEMAWGCDWYDIEVLPGLPRVALSAITRATGLSVSAASRIRAGKLHPHKRHWRALHRLVAE